MKLIASILLFVMLIALGCSSPDKNIKSPSPFKYQLKMDSLLRLERFDEIRKFAVQKLQSLDSQDFESRANFLAAIGTSYVSSYFKDSARIYFEKALASSRNTKDTTLMAVIASGLLMEYSKSFAFQKQQDSLMNILNNLSMANLSANTKLQIYNSVIACYAANDRQGMCQFILTQAKPVCEQLVNAKSLNYVDSANIENYFLYQGVCYSRMNDTGQDSGMESFRKSRQWVRNASRAKAAYYRFLIVGYTDIESKKDVSIPIKYIDSLKALENASGQNFDDFLLISFVDLSDYFYYYEKDYETSWKYHSLGQVYLKHNSNQIFEVWYKWQEGDLYREQSMYKEAIRSFMSIAKYIKEPFNYQRLKMAITIADCYQQEGRLDSALIYYKKIAPFEIGEFRELEKKINKEADAKYIDELQQRKINEQHAIIQYGQNQKIILGTGLVLVVALVVLLLVIYRNKQKWAQKLNTQNTLLHDLNGQLDEANNTKSKLFGIISHDLRAPVSQLYQLLKLQRSTTYSFISIEEKKNLEFQTDAAAIALLDTMEELLIWSKTQMKSFSINNTWVDLRKVFRECQSLLHLHTQSKQVQIKEQIQEGSVIETDVNFLLTIIRNLLHNAINASPPRGIITVSYEQENCLKITNNGPAFTQQDYLDALKNSETSQLLKGGLGLQIVDELSHKINVSVSFQINATEETCCTIRFEKNKAQQL